MVGVSLTKLSTIITVIVGLGTIGVGAFYTLDYFYVSRAELTEFALADQKNNQDTLQKLSELEKSVMKLTKIFLKGEIKSLERIVETLEAIENRTQSEEEYLRLIRDDIKDLEDQLDDL